MFQRLCWWEWSRDMMFYTVSQHAKHNQGARMSFTQPMGTFKGCIDNWMNTVHCSSVYAIDTGDKSKCLVCHVPVCKSHLELIMNENADMSDCCAEFQTLWLQMDITEKTTTHDLISFFPVAGCTPPVISFGFQSHGCILNCSKS